MILIIKTKVTACFKLILDFIRKIIDYRNSPFVFIIIIVTYILFFNKSNLTITLSIITLGFAIFQYWMNYINGVRKSLYDFRANTLKAFLENDIQLSNYLYKCTYNIVMDFRLFLIDVQTFKDNIELGLREIDQMFDKKVTNSIEYSNYKLAYESVLNACQTLADEGERLSKGDVYDFVRNFGKLKSEMFSRVNNLYKTRIELYNALKRFTIPYNYENFL